LSLIFRDENAKVIQKAMRTVEARKHKRRREQEEEQNRLHFHIPNKPHRITAGKFEMPSKTAPPAIPPSLYLNHDIRDLFTTYRDPGLDFFFRRYMTGGCCPSSTTNIQSDIFSAPLWRGVSRHKPFLDAISCVGLAGLSNINHDQEMMRKARLKYAMTLQRVHSSLQAPDSSDIGYIVKAVMLLTIFEVSHPRDTYSPV
jgi:hypothetical protein